MANEFGIPIGAITLTIVSSCMSIFGSIMIFATYYHMPRIQNIARKLLIYLTIADMLTSMGNGIAALRFSLMSDSQRNQTDGLCIAQSVVTTFSSMSSFVWTMVIAFHLFSLVLFRKDFGSRRLTMVKYHILGWALPGIITIVALSLGKLGRGVNMNRHPFGSGPWCWIQTEGTLTSGDIALMFATGKGWEVAAYLISCALYMLLKVSTVRMRKRDPSFNWNRVNNNLKEEDERFCLAWILLYLLRLWGTVRFFLAVFHVNSSAAKTVDSVFLYLQSYGDSGQAFWNFVLFCLLDNRVRRNMKDAFCNNCKCNGEYIPLE